MMSHNQRAEDTSLIASATQPASMPARNVAVDAYRGLVMLLMLAEVLQLSEIALHFPHSLLWQVLGYNQSHVEWVGMSLHDTIQPSFTFLVGVALPYSLRSRQTSRRTFHPAAPPHVLA
jgi:heparan-alpha-glucosaminide N-acetyltransferase